MSRMRWSRIGLISGDCIGNTHYLVSDVQEFAQPYSTGVSYGVEQGIELGQNEEEELVLR